MGAAGADTDVSIACCTARMVSSILDRGIVTSTIVPRCGPFFVLNPTTPDGKGGVPRLLAFYLTYLLT